MVLMLDLVRSGSATTKPELARKAGLGRNVVTQRVSLLVKAGLLEEGELAGSTGGRAARGLKLRNTAGLLLVAPLGVTGKEVAVTDLAGNPLARLSERSDIADGPENVLSRIEEIFDQLLDSAAIPEAAKVWGVGVGLPGPVEFATGRPVNPPIMPGWDLYDVRSRLAQRYNAPVWVDNDVNVLALGEHRAGLARGERHMLYIKVGTGIGAGLISNGLLHRGEKGCAGDIGHVAVAEGDGVLCRCGKVGCLEALAGGGALVRDATLAAQDGHSSYLKSLIEQGKALEAVDVTRAAQRGEAVAVELLTRAGRLIGETLAVLVNSFNPAMVILGGQVVESGDILLAATRETVYRRSLPLATRDLRMTRSRLGRDAGVVGAALMVSEQLFSRARLGLWLDAGSPAGHPELAESVSA